MFTTINSYPTRIEAELAKGLLEANGIKSEIVADDLGGAYSFPISLTFGVQLQVRTEDFEKATKILKISSKKSI